MGVEHDTTAADGVEILDRLRHFVAHHMLHADVEAQFERIAGARGIAQLLVEMLLDAGNALAVDIGVAQHMDGQRTLRIDAALLVMEIEAGHAKAVDFVLLARSEEHTSELQSLMRISYAVFCLNKKK